MKKKIGKPLSIILAAALIVGMIPMFGASALASTLTNEVTLDDGSVWLSRYNTDSEGNPYNNFNVTPSGVYTMTTVAGNSPDSSFTLMQKKAYPSLTSVHNLGVNFYGNTSFGFSTDFAIDSARQVKFYRSESGNSTTIQILIGSNVYDIKTFTATRANLANIGIVKQNGSYYATYRGYVLDGAGCGETVQNAVKLESYFPAEYLENNGALYFYFSASGVLPNYCVNYIAPGDIDNYTAAVSFSGDRNSPSGWVFKKRADAASIDNDYIINSGTGGNSAVLNTPVAIFENDATETAGVSTYMTYSMATNPAFPGQNWHSVSFSNDPYAANWDKFDIVRVDQSGTPHILQSGATLAACTNMLYNAANSPDYYGARYDWKFIKDGSGVKVQILLNGNTVSATSNLLNNVSADKPIYIKFQGADISGIADANLKYRVVVPANSALAEITALETSISEAKTQDITTVKPVLDAYNASPLRNATSYSTKISASEMLLGYIDAVQITAAGMIAKINALPAKEDLLYQQKAEIAALGAEYDALSDSVKALITNADKLAEYRVYAETIVDNGIYRTNNGDEYYIKRDENNIDISSAPNGALVIAATGGQDTAGSNIDVITEATYPILSGKYDLQCNFGSPYSSYFSLSAAGGEVLGNETPNRFILRRMHSGISSSLYVIINGQAQKCFETGGQLASRIYSLGVVKKNGHYYMTYDGAVVDGTGYSTEIQNAVMLEKYFPVEFLENNGMVHFGFGAGSLKAGTGSYAYCMPLTTVKNGTIAQRYVTYTDRNAGNTTDGRTSYAPDHIKSTVNPDSTMSVSGINKTQTSVKISSSASATFTTPIDPKSTFNLWGSMAQSTGNQAVDFYMSNDPSFTNDDVIGFTVYQFANSTQNCLFYKGYEGGGRFYNFFNGGAYELSIVEQNGMNLLCIKSGSSYIHPELDLTALIDAPIYLKVAPGSIAPAEQVTMTLTVQGSDPYKYATGELGFNLPDSISGMTAEQVKTVLDGYYANPYRFLSYDAMKKAGDISLALVADSSAKALAVDNAIRLCFEDTANWFTNRLAIKNAEAMYNLLESYVKNNYVTAVGELNDMLNYLNGLDTMDAAGMVNLRKYLLGVSDKTVTEGEALFDYVNDGQLDVKDLIRLKKEIANAGATEFSNSAAPVQTLYAYEYGAVGDGVRNDTASVETAISMLSCYGPGSVLEFQAGKTYYLDDLSSASFELKNVEGLIIDGKGSRVILGTQTQYAMITDTKNCQLINFAFDYEDSAAFEATAISYSLSECSAVVYADREIGLAPGQVYNAPFTGYFGVLDRGDSRYHMYIKKYEMLTQNTVKIYFNSADANTLKWLSSVGTYGMICPVPGIGHIQERGFTIRHNNNVNLENITVNSCARFGMYIGDNSGIINLTNVDFVPAKGEINFSTWRDAFHCRDNRAVINWTDCDAVWNYDDVLNISASKLDVAEYDSSKRQLSMTWAENSNLLYFDFQVGDRIQVLDTATGKDCGTVTVEQIVRQSDSRNIVIIDKQLENYSGDTSKLYAYVLDRCAAGSTITNCSFSGTFRMRAPLTVTGTSFDVMRMWIGLEAETEGPLPKDILFKNCTFNMKSNSCIYVGYTSGNPKEYHAENIVFENCGIDRSYIIGSDKDYVTIR